MHVITLMISAFTIAYYQNQLEQVHRIHNDVINKAVTAAEERVVADDYDLDAGDKPVVDLLKVIVDILLDAKNTIDKDVILSKIRMGLRSEEYLDILDSLEAIVKDSEMDTNALKDSINMEVGIIYGILDKENLEEIISRAQYEIKKSGRGIGRDYINKVQDLITDLNEFTVIDTGMPKGIVNEINFDDIDSVSKGFEVYKRSKDLASGACLKTGSVTVNKALFGGFYKRKLYVIMALQHKNKSGILNSFLTSIAMSNYPEISEFDESQGYTYKLLKDGKKQLVNPAGTHVEHTIKPLILKITFEDESENNLHYMYQYCHQHVHGVIDKQITDKSDEELAMFIKSIVEETGFTFKIIRVNPSTWKYTDIINLCESYNRDGYRVDALGLDYLLLVPTTGCKQGSIGDDVMDMFRRVRDYISANNIMCITPHQLRTAAKDLLSEGVLPRNFAREIDGLGYSAGSRSIDREVDSVLNIHLFEHTDGRTYQHVHVEKYRDFVITKASQDVYIQFPKEGSLLLSDEAAKFKLPVVT